MTETLSAGSGATPQQGLLTRVIGVIFSPREAFAAVVARPKWLGAVAIAVLISGAAQFALLSTEVGKEKIYLKDDAAKARFLAERPNHKKEFQRLKGLGEMDWEELKVTTMDPETRTLLQVTVEEAAEADMIMSILMGDDVESRREFITTNARDVRNLDF